MKVSSGEGNGQTAAVLLLLKKWKRVRNVACLQLSKLVILRSAFIKQRRLGELLGTARPRQTGQRERVDQEQIAQQQEEVHGAADGRRGWPGGGQGRGGRGGQPHQLQLQAVQQGIRGVMAVGKIIEEVADQWRHHGSRFGKVNIHLDAITSLKVGKS